MSNDKITATDIKKEAQRLNPSNTKKNNTMTHSKILEQLLEEVTEISFRERADIDTNKKLSTRHYVVHSIKEILRLAKENQWGLCQQHGFIYIYNGSYWSRIEEDEFKIFLGKAAKKLGWEESYSDHYKYKDELFKQFESAGYLPVPKHASEEVLINLQNGTFVFTEDGHHLKDFDSKDFLTYQLPFEYDPVATAPKFQTYLDEVLPDESLQKVLAEFAGYLFIPHQKLKLEKVLMLYGTGGNGKSVFFDVLKALLGTENFSTYSLQSLTDNNGYYRADLSNRIVNYASEISGRVETSYFKTLASGEPIEARLPYKDPIIVKNYAKMIFNVNSLPIDVEHNEGFFRRFLIIPFEVNLKKEDMDRKLAQKIIKDELPGIFNWILKGLERVREQEGFTKSEKINAVVNSFRKESNSVALFMDDKGYKNTVEGYVVQAELYKYYKYYSQNNGYRAVSNIKFGKRLEALGFERGDKSVGKVVYVKREKGC